MNVYPLHNAALDLRGKLPEELPHGRLAILPEVREAVEEERPKMRPEAFEYNKMMWLNNWTVSWYFDGLGYEVIYRETPEGPEILAVGSKEVWDFSDRLSYEERRKLKTFLGY